MKKNKLFIFLLFLGVIVYASCKHYIDSPSEKDSISLITKQQFNAAKSYFESSIKGSDIKNIKSSMFPDGKLTPDWGEGERIGLPNGLSLLVVDMPEAKATSTRFSYVRKAIFYEYNSTVIDGYIIEVVAEPEVMKKFKESVIRNFNQAKIPGFTGSIIINNLQNKYLGSNVYKDGTLMNAQAKILKNTGIWKKTGYTKINARGGRTLLTDETNCVEWWRITTVRDEYGNIIEQWEDYLYTDCESGGGDGGGGGTPTVTVDCNGTVNGSAYVAACGCIGGTTGIPFCPKNPCIEKLMHALRASDAVNLANKNTIIANSISKEWGAEQKVSNPFGITSYLNIPARTDASSNTFSANFSWDAINGYTTGVAHGHPQGSAPSPIDIFWMLEQANDADLIASGNLDYYKKTISVTVYTPNGTTYVVTVNDWAALTALHNTYKANRQAFLTNWSLDGGTFINNNNPSDPSLALAWASLIRFGNSINIYRAPPGSTNLEPLITDPSNWYNIATKYCP